MIKVFRQRVALSPWLFRLFFGDEIRPSYLGIINMINHYKHKDPVFNQPGFHEFRIRGFFSYIICMRKSSYSNHAVGSRSLQPLLSYEKIQHLSWLCSNVCNAASTFEPREKKTRIRNPSDIRRLLKMTESDFFMAL